jgi:hypothetical protein
MSAERPNTACDDEDWQRVEMDIDYGWLAEPGWIPCQNCVYGEPLVTFADDWLNSCWCCHGEYPACERCTEELTP